jgi:hypothetical protein
MTSSELHRQLQIDNDDDDEPLPPAQIAATYDNSDIKKSQYNAKPTASVSTNRDEYSNIPTVEDMEADERRANINVGLSQSGVAPPKAVSSVQSSRHQQVIRRPPPPSMLVDPRASTTTSNEVRQTDTSTRSTLVLEATLVPDMPVYDATPIVNEEGNEDDELPWWKRHQKYIYFALVVLLLGLIVVIAVITSAGAGSDNNQQDSLPQIDTDKGTNNNEQDFFPPANPQKVSSKMNAFCVYVYLILPHQPFWISYYIISRPRSQQETFFLHLASQQMNQLLL